MKSSTDTILSAVELFQVYEALLGTDGLKFCNGGEGRKRRMPCCEALSVNAVKKMHNMLLMVCINLPNSSIILWFS